MRRLALPVLIGLAFAAFCSSSAAFSLRPIGDFDQPVYVTSSPGNPNRLLIVEREGRIIESSPAGTQQLADLTELVSCCKVERGMLSIAPAPDFESSGRIYATYTGTPQAGGAEGDVHLDSFRPDPSGGALIREPILTIDHSEEPNHNGGQLQFGPDGHLYVSLGDGGGGGDPFENGQNKETLLGKILRIDPRPGQDPPYAIPPDNPFVGGAGRDEIWAYGLRNPWRFSFDRLTGDMVIGDVGQGSREEVDYAPSPGGGVVSGGGANYGWNCREGLIAFSDPATACAGASGFTDPVFDYVHQDPVDGAAYGCSIIGGYVVRDGSLGDLYGRYIYADFCIGQIRSLLLPATASGMASGDRSEAVAVPMPTSFGEDSGGRLYVASEEGPVYRLEGPTPPAASVTASAPKRLAKHDRLLLSARRLRRGGSRFVVRVRLTPCWENTGLPVQLSRNGKSFASKRLNRHCRARFLLTVAKPTPIRAFVRLGDEGERIGAHRLVLLPPSGP